MRSPIHLSSSNSGAALSRRRLLASGAGATTCLMLSLHTSAHAATDDLAAAVASYTGGAAVRAGKVRLDIAELVDNGNVVPMTVTVDSPMTAAEHVNAIAVFNEKNPLRDVARFTLGPGAGKARVSTRIRLATSQKLVAIARMSDGSFWSHTVDVIVTIAACVE
jgi:sulfur-oxidizing protein SoxY